ncbi:MAG: FdtA/QdtA family cupin domain-containing protein [Candidatus Gracilibacteria bacterium]|nr:FdtA/QdtA family cupin domain-containing protein [Candidatus Gracilibacteria bacterium]
MRAKIIDLKAFGDQQMGYLVPIELNEKIPFEVKRAYFLYGMDQKATRGGHAHIIEQEVFVCAKGSCKAIIDQGQGKEEITMNNAEKALFTDTMTWHEFTDFSKDCVLLALSSVNYTPGDTNYITSYEEFLQKIKGVKRY